VKRQKAKVRRRGAADAKQHEEIASNSEIIISLIIVGFLIWGAYLIFKPSQTSSVYESFHRSSSLGAVLTKRCAAEAGIPTNDPQHRITPEEMQRLASCLDHNAKQ